MHEPISKPITQLLEQIKTMQKLNFQIAFELREESRCLRTLNKSL
jgi:hypothetical protein